MESARVTIRIPNALLSYTSGEREVQVTGSTAGQAVEDLTRRFPSLRTHLYSPEGELRSFVNLFINDENIRSLQGVETPLKESDLLRLVPSIAGG